MDSSQGIEVFDHVQVGQLFKERRLELELPQCSIAGVSQGAVSKVERGQTACNIDQFIRFAQEIGFKVVLVENEKFKRPMNSKFKRVIRRERRYKRFLKLNKVTLETNELH